VQIGQPSTHFFKCFHAGAKVNSIVGTDTEPINNPTIPERKAPTVHFAVAAADGSALAANSAVALMRRQDPVGLQAMHDDAAPTQIVAAVPTAPRKLGARRNRKDRQPESC
jgi:hypothetical protein